MNSNPFPIPLMRTILLLICSLLISTAAFAATIDSQLSRDPVSMNESFQLTFRADSAPDADPDFSVLEQDFEILNRSSGQNIQMINGAVSRSVSWTLTLMARRSGQLQIPAVSFGSDRSKPITITVKQAAAASSSSRGEDIFLELEATPKSALVQQQVLLTLRLYRAVNVGNASLSAPESNDPDLISKKLGEDRQYETQIDGRRYLVVERRYALFPQQAGTLQIKPITFQGEITRRGGSSMFRSPLTLFDSTGQMVRVRSEALAIPIQPIPAGATDGPWLPASQLQLAEDLSVDLQTLKVGEPITRTLALIADGLTSAQLPPLSLSLPDGLKQYPDQPLLHDREGKEGITGIRQQKIALIPSKPGDFTLPAISVGWWNVQTGKRETATLPARTLRVQPAASSSQPQSTAAAAQPPEPDRQPVAEGQPTATVAALPALPAAAGITPWLLSLALAIGWLASGLICWRRCLRSSTATALSATDQPEREESARKARRKLKQAALADDPAATAKALLHWAALQWRDGSVTSLGEIAQRFPDSGFSHQIDRLQQHLYAAQGEENWQGGDLWQQFTESVTRQQRQHEQRSPIAPLNPPLMRAPGQTA